MSILSENVVKTIGEEYDIYVTVYNDINQWSNDLTSGIDEKSKYASGRLANVILHKIEDLPVAMCDDDALQRVFEQWIKIDDVFHTVVNNKEYDRLIFIQCFLDKFDGQILRIELYKL